MKKILLALAASLLIGLSLTADDWCYSENCTDCFGFDCVLSYDVGGGYRQDNIQWDAYPPLVIGDESVPPLFLKEKWNDLQMGVVETNGQLLAFDHYLVKADFDFGWFNNRNGNQTIELFQADPDLELTKLESRTKGRMYDVSGALGYQFNWCCYRYAFTPLAGYSYHFQKLKNEEYHNKLDSAAKPIFVHNDYIYRWKGPTLGFTAGWQICTNWQLYFTYNYHWLRFRGNVKERFVVDQPRLKMKSNNCSGNEFLLGTIYQFSEYWYLGIKVDYKCFTGNKGDFKTEHAKVYSEYPMRKLKWDSLLVTMDVGILF